MNGQLRQFGRWEWQLFIGILLFGFTHIAQAQRLVIDPAQNQILDEHFEVLNDPSRTLTLKQVMSQPDNFHPSDDHRINLGYTQQAVWLKVSLYSASDLRRILMFRYPYLDRIDCYIIEGNQVLSHQYSGFTIPPAERSIEDIHPTFLLSLKAGHTQSVYLRIIANGAMALNSTLFVPKLFHQSSEQMLFAQTLFIGMALALTIYNLFLGIVLRRLPLLLYAGFISSFAVATMAANGVGGLYLWPLLGPIINHIVPTGFSIAVVWALLFARHFLNLQEIVPRFNKVHQWVTYLCLVMALSTIILPVQIGVQIMSLLGTSMAAFLILCGYIGIRHKVPAARYYLAAWLFLLIGSAMVSIRNTGLIPSNFITVYGMQIGSTIEMLLLSFGLATHFNELKKQKEYSQTALLNTLKMQEHLLEQRVSERTQELALVNAKLEVMAIHDPLTQTLNRLGLSKQFDQLKATASVDQPLAILQIDLDGFKQINDQYGHAVGDVLLKVIAKRLQSECRPTDLVARMGGDEFAVICFNIDNRPQLLGFSSRLRDQLAAPIQINSSLQIQVGASIGACLSTIGHFSLDQLLQYADQAMYQIKNSHKGNVALDDRITNLFFNSAEP
ncbi:7TM diverse intracellular signaling domain-containing protein [Celerinatantimonas yamalensis]|uniref:Diguanylate cyclase n=1 Tax=Celerinatantimonas yamalensis TaxID=559956 RepID=A0ABW9G8H6_9GAMM